MCTAHQALAWIHRRPLSLPGCEAWFSLTAQNSAVYPLNTVPCMPLKLLRSTSTSLHTLAQPLYSHPKGKINREGQQAIRDS